jgi:tetratricopeptide (TPR) repeat protein
MGLRNLIAGIILLFTVSLQAQDEVLAAQYFHNGEYDKAAILYEKIYAKKNDPEIYENYFQSLLSLKQYDNAIKLAKKQVKRNEENVYYMVDPGYVLVQSGKADKAKELFSKLIEERKKDAPYYLNLANAFIHRELYDEAKQTYLTARSRLGDENLFQMELARLYSETHNKEGTITELLNLLEYNEGMLDYVQNMLQGYLTQPRDLDMLKSAINKRAARAEDRLVYTRLLEWLFVQQKNWELAFIQAKAIDKRQGTWGDECMKLASICIDNDSYPTAYSIYQYIAGLGTNKPYYLAAREGLLNTASKKTFYSGKYTSEDLESLKRDYIAFLSEFGNNENTVRVMHDLASLEAFYMDDKSGASSLLEKAIALGNVPESYKAECKLMLGDIKLLAGEEWEANLLYAQVDRDFKEEPLGQEAKFRNAKLSFYQGDFTWSLAQLDILKTATSQLISNNAIELSLLIQDNTADSVYEPLEMYAAADLLIYQNKYNAALQKLDSIVLLYPYHSLNDEILFSKGKLMARQQDYVKACEYYQQVVTKAPDDILADNALWEMAQIYEKTLNDPQKAKKYYEDLILKYPGSMFTVEARKHYRALRGDAMN